LYVVTILSSVFLFEILITGNPKPWGGFEYLENEAGPFNKRTKFGQYGHWLRRELLGDPVKKLKRKKKKVKASTSERKHLKPAFRKKRKSGKRTLLIESSKPYSSSEDLESGGTPTSEHDEWEQRNEFYNL